jgi:outer membrane protein TolC
MKASMLLLGACLAAAARAEEPEGAGDGLPPVVDLESAQAYALRESPTLEAASARVEQARQRVNQARAAWFPQLTASGSASKTYLSDRDLRAQDQAARAQLLGTVQGLLPQVLGQAQGGGMTGQGLFQAGSSLLTAIREGRSIDDSTEAYSANITATWVVFNGFERKFRQALARHGRRQSEAAYRESSRLLLSAVAATYYAAQFARESIAIAEADRDFNERQLEDAKARRAAGTGSLSDVLNFQVRVNGAKSSAIAARESYASALLGLAELMAVEGGDWPQDVQLAPLSEATPAEMETPPAEELVALALAQRPDLEANRLGVESAGAGVEIARSRFYPTVTATASKEAFRSDDWRFDGDDFSTTVGLNVSYPLFTGGRDTAALREAKAAKTEAEYALHGARNTAVADVRIALESLKAAQAELRIQTENVELVRRNRNLTEKAYRGDLVALVRLNEAQRDLLRAEVSLAQAQVGLRQAWHDLKTATGEILEDYDLSGAP